VHGKDPSGQKESAAAGIRSMLLGAGERSSLLHFKIAAKVKLLKVTMASTSIGMRFFMTKTKY